MNALPQNQGQGLECRPRDRLNPKALQWLQRPWCRFRRSGSQGAVPNFNATGASRYGALCRYGNFHDFSSVIKAFRAPHCFQGPNSVDGATQKDEAQHFRLIYQIGPKVTIPSGRSGMKSTSEILEIIYRYCVLSGRYELGKTAPEHAKAPLDVLGVMDALAA